MDWLEELRKEGAVITNAPFSFCIVVVVCAVATWFVNHLLYSKNLEAKDDLLRSYKEQITDLSSGKQLASPQELVRSRQIGRHLKDFPADGQRFLQFVAVRGKVFKSAYDNSGVQRDAIEQCISLALKKGLIEKDRSPTSGEEWIAMTTPVQHAILFSLGENS